jgi:hypothetical protein
VVSRTLFFYLVGLRRSFVSRRPAMGPAATGEDAMVSSSFLFPVA